MDADHQRVRERHRHELGPTLAVAARFGLRSERSRNVSASRHRLWNILTPGEAQGRADRKGLTPRERCSDLRAAQRLGKQLLSLILAV
jgi:hypothetical protein